tara:strand:+ start:591 stop:890 length:300 start_codon:yes stop_codon:yes gene_type:complete
MPSEQDIDSLMKAVGTLKAMANPKRLAILCRLGEKEESVSELSSHVDLSQSALSQHLAKLRELNLVATRREQQTIYYHLDSPEIKTLIEALRSLYCKKD